MTINFEISNYFNNTNIFIMTVLPGFIRNNDHKKNIIISDEDKNTYKEIFNIISNLNYLIESNWNLVKIMENDFVGISLKKREGIFTGHLGHSEKHNESVGTLIWNRLHISAFFGLTGFLLTYLVCIPLGIISPF